MGAVKSRWREHARPIIAKVFAESKDRTDKEIKKALYDAYPFGERDMHPYKIWCSEVKRQRQVFLMKRDGISVPDCVNDRFPLRERDWLLPEEIEDDPNQLQLF